MIIIRKLIRIAGIALAGFLLLGGEIIQAQNLDAALDPNQGKAETVVAPANPMQANPMQAQPVAPLTLSADDSTYTLGADDIIQIVVTRHPEVSGQYLLNNEGKIQYGFVGDIAIAGLTKKELKDLLVERLSTYIVNPDITVTIVGYNSKTVYVIGEVGNPGRIFMRGDTITVRDALLQAGLPLLSASTRRCRLITPTADGNAGVKYVDVFRLLYEGDLREDLVMKPGDTLYIPATALAKAMRVISPVAQPVSEAGNAARPIATGGF